MNQLRSFILTAFSLLTPDLGNDCKDLAFNLFKKTRYTVHLNFLNNCIRLQLIPKGFNSNFNPASASFNSKDKSQLLSLERKVAFQRMRLLVHSHKRYIAYLSTQIYRLEDRMRSKLSDNHLALNFIRVIIHQLNRDLYLFLSTNKKKKLGKLKPPQVIPQQTTTNKNLVICIPPDLPLSENERSLLSKGLKFIPLTPSCDRFQLQSDSQRFFRALRLQFHFAGKNNTLPDDELFPFKKQRKSTWTPPPGQSKALDLYIKSTENDIKNLLFPRLRKSNLSKVESKALSLLRSRKDIVIKPADKGGAVVVWDKELYIKEAQRQLEDTQFYQQRATDPIMKNNTVVKKTIDELITECALPQSASRMHIFDSDLGKPSFYLLPKIHKDGNPGRPIVSACSCPTEHISEFLDSVFQPIVASLPTYIKDTNHALRTFDSLSINPNVKNYLFLLDVCSLYTSIPHNDGLLAVQYFLDRQPHPNIPTHALLRLAELVLTLNSFEFNGQFFDQISGVAMGTKMGPSYACLFMGHFEHRVEKEYTGRLPEFYKRYIDDGIGVTHMERSELDTFINFVDSFHPSIKFTHTISELSVNFLDITVTLQKNCLLTSAYFKPTDSHSYLLYPSSHPKSCKDSIPFSQLLRLRRLCQSNEDFLEKALEMVEFF